MNYGINQTVAVKQCRKEVNNLSVCAMENGAYLITTGYFMLSVFPKQAPKLFGTLTELLGPLPTFATQGERATGSGLKVKVMLDLFYGFKSSFQEEAQISPWEYNDGALHLCIAYAGEKAMAFNRDYVNMFTDCSFNLSDKTLLVFYEEDMIGAIMGINTAGRLADYPPHVS